MSKGARNKDQMNRQLLQVFAPSSIVTGSVIAVTQDDVLRFTVAGQYQINGAGEKALYPAGMIMGINELVTSISIFDADTGATPESQTVEVM